MKRKAEDIFDDEEASFEDECDQEFEDQESLEEEKISEVFDSLVDEFSDDQLEILFDLLSDHLDK